MQVTEDIHIIDEVKGAQVFLIMSPKPFIVDTGFPGQEKAIFRYLNKVGLNPEEITAVILTHYDVDHIGSAAALQRTIQCPVFAHDEEIPYILNQKRRPGIKRILPALIKPVYGAIRLPNKLLPLKDGDNYSNWDVIHTPGHTPGHLVLYNNGIAIVGDLLQGGNIRLAPDLFTWNQEQLKKSVIRIIDKPLKWILPGHGICTPYKENWLAALKQRLSIKE